MNYQDPNFSKERKNPSAVLDRENASKNFPQSWLARSVGRLGIGKKIALGYTLAIGVAVLGTSVGQIVGENIIERQALQEQNRAQQEEYLLTSLKIAVLEAHSHQQLLISLQEYPQEWKLERAHSIGHINKIKQLLSELAYRVENPFKKIEPDKEAADLQKFSQSYAGAVYAYIQNLEAVIQPIDSANFSPKTIAKTVKELLKVTKSDAGLKFDSLSDKLTKLIETAHQEKRAAEGAVERAEILRVQITTASLLMSIAIASAMALQTSRAIARPIEKTTKVAQQVTEQANFKLQAPVTTSDEIGRLTISFNQMIRRVATYADELERARTDRDRFFNLSLDLLCIADFDGYFKQLNPSWEKALGFTTEELCGLPYIEFVHLEDRGKTLAETEKLKAGIETISFENRYSCKDGSYKWLLWTSVPSTAEGLIYAVVRDITAQKRSEEMQTRLVNILEKTPDFVGTIDIQGRGIYLNQAGRRLLGIAADADISNGYIPKAHPPQVLELILEQAIPTAIKNGVWSGETTFLSSDGREITASQLFLAHKAVNGSVDFISTIARDISDRKRSEATIRESEERFRLMADTAPIMIWTSDVDKRCDYFNKVWLDFTGRTLDRELGLGWAEGVHPDDFESCLNNYIAAFDARQSFQMEYRLRRADGEYRWILDRGNPRFLADGSFTGYIGSCLDISDRFSIEEALKQANESLENRVQERTAQLRQTVEQLESEMAFRARAEAALNQEREFLKALLNNLAEGIVACDENGILTWFNQATREFHGLPNQPISAEQWAEHYDLYLPDGKTPMQKQEIPLFRALQGETIRDVEVAIAPKQGKARTLLASGQAIIDATGKKLGAVVTMHDISDRKQSEAALRESESRLNSILNSLQDVVWSVSATTFKILYLNPAAERVYKRQVKEFFENPNLWLELVHPEDRDRAFKYNQKIQEFGNSEIEYRIIRNDGEVRWIRDRGRLISDETGQIIRIDGTISDITDRKEAEKIQARLNAILEATPDFVGTSDALGNALYINRAGRKMLGIGEDEDISSLHISEFCAESAREIIMTEGVPAACKDGVWIGETALQYRNSREIPVSQVIVGHKGENTEVEFISTIARDITAAKQAEQALRQSETKLAEAQKIARVGWWEFDLVTGAITWSEEMFRIWGMKPNRSAPTYEEYVQKVYPEDREILIKAIEGAIVRGQSYDLDHRIWRPDGSIGYIYGKGQPIFDAQGQVIKLFGTSLDVSDRKRSEAALRQSEELYRALAQNFPNGAVFIFNRDLRYILADGSELSAAELSTESLEGKTLWEVTSPQTSAIMEPMLRSALSGIANSAEIPFGDRIYFTQVLPLSDRQGEIFACMVVSQNITDRKRLEEAQRQREEHWRQIIQNMPVMMDAFDADGNITVWNRECERVTGYSAEELVGNPKAVELLYPEPNYRDSMIVQWAERGNNYRNWEINLTAKDGTVKTIAWSNISDEFPIPGWATWGIGTDVSDRKGAEEALRRSEAQFRQLAQREALLNQLASQIRKSLDVDTILETVVSEIRSLLQLDRCLFIWYRASAQKPMWDVVKEAKLPDLPSFLGEYPISANSITEKLINLEMFRADDLSVATVPAHQELYTVLGFTAVLTLPIQTPSGEIGLVICAHHSSSRAWCESEIELLKAAINQLAIALFQAELYTQSQHSARQAHDKAQQLQQTLHQLQQTQSQLIQTEKMSSLGQLVAGIAHEINNPVNFIHGNLAHLSDYTQELLALISLYQHNSPYPDSELQKVLDEIDINFIAEDMPKVLSSMKMGTERIRNIVLSLRNFSRLDEADMKAVDVHEGIENTLLILHHRLKAKPGNSDIQIVKEYGSLPLVECYAGQLNQVFVNVISNAIDALENQLESRAISIRTSVGNGNWKLPNGRSAEFIPNSHIAICIADNGPGMSPDVKNRLFDPFFTTKPVGKGTGLGLAISYQIVVEKHGGVLRCESVPGKGTEFWIEIPIKQTQFKS